MIYLRLLMGLCLYLLATAEGQAQNNPLREGSLQLVAPEFKPYTYNRNGEAVGVGVYSVEVLLSQLQQPYQIRMAPNYGRALWLTRRAHADGFFLASQNSERDKVAKFFGPLFINRWNWFLPPNSQLNPDSDEFKQQHRVGTLISTNTHRWLIQNQYQQIKTFNDVNVLLEAMQKNEIEAVFLAELVLNHAAHAINYDLNHWNQKTQIAKPFGIYIAHHWLQQHPTFGERLRQAIAESAIH